MNVIKWYETQDYVCNSSVRRYMRVAGVDSAGEVYLSAGVFDENESITLHCMNFDGVPLVAYGGHLYCPATWLRREYPGKSEAIQQICQSVMLGVRYR